jgi:5-hydroxyisourate hydrolase
MVSAWGLTRHLACSAHDEVWTLLTRAKTNADGRTQASIPPGGLVPGVYRVCFHTAAYFARFGNLTPFYPRPCVDFCVLPETAGQHFHIPLLLSPFSYSTYRGS